MRRRFTFAPLSGLFAAGAVVALSACSPEASQRGAPALSTVAASAATAPSSQASSAAQPRGAGRRTLSIVGTNDLHGRIAALPLFGGYLRNLRAVRARDDGAVLLLDGGDLFQGTIESNAEEGMPVIRAYAALGYHAVTVGNHEFDYGPEGPAATPRAPGDDPRGALKKLAAAAPFPLLTANLLDASTKKRVDWPKMPASIVVELAGTRVGLIGVTTEDTLTTTIHANVADLAMAPLAKTIAAEGARLRKEERAELVVVLAHAGGKCAHFTGSVESDRCEMGSEIFRVAKALPRGAVDAIVAGHTHAGLAHEVEGIPIIEQFAYGKAFGRIDLELEGSPARIVERKIHAPKDLCPSQSKGDPDWSSCDAGDYEGARVERDAEVERTVRPALDAARARREELLGPELVKPAKRDYDDESSLGNLIVDWMLEAVPEADVALTNGGGLRADLPAGPLRYGALFEAFPFDNRVGITRITGARLEAIVRAHLRGGGGVFSFGGVRVEARCTKGELELELRRPNGRRIEAAEPIVLVASDFLLTGGDDFWGGGPPGEVELRDELVRDAVERVVRKKQRIDPSEAFTKAKPRLRIPERRPLRCGRSAR
jgi:2',3'-cyclic-nucleotide 2'-phosphodiesterase (5'-nucleotidase family)